MGPADWVYLNGSFCHAASAAISPFDRGFLFAHAAYEVTSVFDGRLIDFTGHVARLQRTLLGIDIETDWDRERLEALHLDLLRRNNVSEGFVYLQVTGGAYGNRDFGGPETLKPGLFLFCEARRLIGEKARDGVAAILVEDQRWKRRDYKTTQLLAQALAYRDAAKAGASSAILHEDGMVTEAASANLWVVTEDGTLITRNLGHQILPGVTRQSILDRLAGSGLAVEERAIAVQELRTAREVFTTATTSMVLPVVTLDGRPVADGKPGPVTRHVQGLYYRAIGADIDARAPWLNAFPGSLGSKP
ncbi:aminotransferase class IV [Henriciella aquimarina]|uniref:aminotransferase class IV n=1 Tax=Henriciella aquimarina TaxID=545261 RepID=UPI000A04596A|nr:aminotransferase class IV [Henriciella aquimarina]